MTRDRVFRFLPTFDSPDEATRFADTQARTWLLEDLPLAAPAQTVE